MTAKSFEIINRQGFKIPIGNHIGKKIIIGSDHRGFDLKEKIKEFLQNSGYEVEDVGTDSTERVDYPDFAQKIAGKISQDDQYQTIGIGICGSGVGMAMVAGKFPGVYPALVLDEDGAVKARKHNNSNFLVLAADKLDFTQAEKILKKWLETPFYESPEEEAYLTRFIKTLEIEKV